MGQCLPFQNQPYLCHTFQQPIQPQYGMSHPGYPRGMQIPIAQVILEYLGYPPLDTGLVPHSYQYPSNDPNH